MQRREGRRIMVYGRGAIECWLAERVKKNEPVVPVVDDDLAFDLLSLEVAELIHLLPDETD